MTPVVVRLRELRELAGLTQDELAEKSGIDQGTLSRIEAGRTKRIDFATIDSLCAALGCEPGELIERTGEQ